MGIRYKTIKEITYPKCYQESLKRIGALLKESTEESKTPLLECGAIYLKEFPEELDVPYLLFLWISDMNNVITSLNIVIKDLHILGKHSFMFEGSPRDRFYFLVRAYFHEFYRMKDVYYRGLKALEIRGLIQKEERDEQKKIFYEVFKTIINIRNKIVHESLRWKGRKFYFLMMLDLAERFGYSMKRIKNGKILSYQKVLNNLCKEWTKMLLEVGKELSEVLQYIVNLLVEQVESKKNKSRW